MHKSEKFWNRVASKSSEKPGGTSLQVIQQSQKYLTPEDAILDIGCGNGSITTELAKAVKHVDAIDISSRMLEFAQEAAERKSIRNIDFRKATLEDLSTADRSYSVVTAFSVLHYIEDTTGFARQVYELLNPVGYFISSTPCLGDKKSSMNKLVLFLSKIRILPPVWFYKKEELESSLKKAGFEMVEAEMISEMQENFLVAKKTVKNAHATQPN